eukprot:m.64233 g.64233  ORF g.64233 m.64233 type:complete len:54 (+) comp11992_c1_seq1:2056-2217(+)
MYRTNSVSSKAYNEQKTQPKEPSIHNFPRGSNENRNIRVLCCLALATLKGKGH